MKPLTRRALLGTLVLSAAGCSTVIDRLTEPDLPKTLTLPGGLQRSPTAHLLNRAAYGPRPGDLERVEKMGRAAWIDQQLDDAHLDDNALAWRLRRYDTLSMNTRDLLSLRGADDKDYVRAELVIMTLLRAVYSQRQLFEVMVGFWSDHFNIYHYKGDAAMLKTADDRDVIRQHALGTFGDLLTASAHSPAMLVYLDNILNEKSHPNENYAREVMELHTLGVDGGYTEQDVKEVARCFTGWSVNRRGEFTFISDWHDDGSKTVLGQTIPAGGGKADGDRVLRLLSGHPNTARHIVTKLARRFVADDPPPGVVEACVTTWTATGGDVRAVLRTLLAHSDFWDAPPKFKRPYELLVSLLRATGATFNADAGLITRLDRLGQRPFGWPTPDGYPDTATAWNGTMLGRWNLALDALAGNLPGVTIKIDALSKAGGVNENDPSADLTFFGRLLLGRDLEPDDTAALRRFAGDESGGALLDHAQLVTLLGMLASSPAFQWR